MRIYEPFQKEEEQNKKQRDNEYEHIQDIARVLAVKMKQNQDNISKTDELSREQDVTEEVLEEITDDVRKTVLLRMEPISQLKDGCSPINYPNSGLKGTKIFHWFLTVKKFLFHR